MKYARNDWLIIAALVLATLVLYGRTASFEFVHYDDPEYVFRNPNTLAGLSGPNVRWAFTTFELANWHPLTWLSYMTDVTVFGPNRPGPMHLVNAVLHAANAVLLFALLRAMTGARWRAALVAALFALHPLHVESVAWIAERKDVLSTLFGLLAMLAYAWYARQRSALAYLLVLVAFAGSLLAKPMLVTLPFLLLVLDYWPLERLSGRGQWVWRVTEKAPLMVMSAASSWVTYVAQQSGGAVQALGDVSMPVRLANAAVSYMRYLFDMIWPARLAMLYPMPRVHSILLAGAAALLLIAITVMAMRRARTQPHLVSGWFWYLGTLVPVIGIVAVGEQARADRYTYFPLIGIFVMIAWSLPVPRTRAVAALTGALAAIVLVALSAQTWRQIGVWRNSETLHEHALSIAGPHPTLYLNYAIALSDKGQHERAIELYHKAIGLRPGFAKSYNNLGNSLLRLQRWSEAEAAYRRAIEINPRYALAYYNLGTLLGVQGRLAEAEAALREALRLKPDYVPALNNLNKALHEQGKPTITSPSGN